MAYMFNRKIAKNILLSGFCSHKVVENKDTSGCPCDYSVLLGRAS